MIFTDRQKKAFDLYRKGENIFISGAAGSGKSTLIKQIYQDAIRGKKKVKITAMTGCASILLGCKARTLHSFAGIGIGSGTMEENILRVRKNFGKCASWRSTELLIVDEISMMSKKILEILDNIGKIIRKRPDEPFGGIQLVFSGDFYQIKPVQDNRDPDTESFCFESPLWDIIFKKENQIKLTQIFRQQNDTVYVDILNAIREGRLTDKHIEIMNSRVCNYDFTDEHGLKPTKLFPTRRQVDQVNQEELDKLPIDGEQIYELEILTDLPMTASELKKRTKITKEELDRELSFLRKSILCEDSLRLRIGTQVMCIINQELPDKTYLVNGSQGIVIGFDDTSTFPIIRFRNGIEHIMSRHTWNSEFIPGIGISQIPLIIAFSTTVHKVQGATMDIAQIDVGKFIFEYGQTYVALSRVKSLDGLFLTSFDPSKIYVNPKVIEYYNTLD